MLPPLLVVPPPLLVFSVVPAVSLLTVAFSAVLAFMPACSAAFGLGLGGKLGLQLRVQGTDDALSLGLLGVELVDFLLRRGDVLLLFRPAYQ